MTHEIKFFKLRRRSDTVAYRKALALRHIMTYLEAIELHGPIYTLDVCDASGVFCGAHVRYALKELRKHGMIAPAWVGSKRGPIGMWIATERGKIAVAVHRGQMARKRADAMRMRRAA